MPTTNIYDIAATWNDGATTFTGIKLNVTDTASASGSLLMDLQVGGTSKFGIGKDGKIYAGASGYITTTSGMALGTTVTHGVTIDGNGSNASHLFAINYGANQRFCLTSTSGPQIRSTLSYAWGNTAEGISLELFRDASDVMAQRRGTNAQEFRLYNTYTNASNYERGFMKWSSNVLEIGVEAAGTGSTRVVHISNLPTSNPGAGILWNNAGTPAIGT